MNLKPMLTMSLLFLCLKIEVYSQVNFIENRIDHIYRDLESNYSNQGASISVFNADSILYQKHFGIQDHISKSPINDSSMFYLSDITKTVIATAIQHEFEKGILHPDSIIGHYLPHLNLEESLIRDIKVQELLYHYSGIREMEFRVERKYSAGYYDEKTRLQKGPKETQKLTKDISENTIYFDAQKKTKYSNVNYLLLVDLIETVNKTTFNDYCQKTFFHPLGIESATFSHIKDQYLVHPYRLFYRDFPEDSTERAIQNVYRMASPYHMNSAYIDGLYMSTSDFTKWIQYLLRLNNNSYQGAAPKVNIEKVWQQKSEIKDVDFWYLKAIKGGLSMGWHNKTILNTDIVISFSQTPGFPSVCFIVPEKNIGVCILSNTNDFPALGLSYSLLEIINEEQLIY